MPDVLVKSVTQEVLAIVRADKEIQSGNTKKTIALVEEKVLPHFNFTRMTALPEYLINIFAQPDAHNSFLIETYTDCILRVLICVSSFAVMNYRFGS